MSKRFIFTALFTKMHSVQFVKSRSGTRVNKNEEERGTRVNNNDISVFELNILRELIEEGFKNQRYLADCTGHSIGKVNKSLKILQDINYIDESCKVKEIPDELTIESKPRNAVILAAGFGMRMVPVNNVCPKALIEINGEILIERIIRQLHEKNINEIYVVVGFQKELFEYLIDEYNVKLIVNTEYSTKNNLHSLAIAGKHINNTYIIPADMWCKENPFRKCELYSWYMVSDEPDAKSEVKTNRSMELTAASKDENGNRLIGISYIMGNDSPEVKKLLEDYDSNRQYDDCFWEQVLFDNNSKAFNCYARMTEGSKYVEINTYEQLREMDENSKHLESAAISIIAREFNVKSTEITDIKVLKKGMTNRSFTFRCNNNKYIMRIPGEGTEAFINREQEAGVYKVLKGQGISDNVIYIDPATGIKITEYVDDARVCDGDNLSEVNECMKFLKQFHDKKLTVDHDFDLFGQIEFYESLRGNTGSVFKDYSETKENLYRLKEYINGCEINKCLTHIDAVPDNFLFSKKGLKLIDWEYSGMQDPHVDIAMFAIYAFYDKEMTDKLIDMYFDGKCDRRNRIKIYCYMAICGFLWSNWCEYKRMCGVEFGEYSLVQYRYAKEFYRLAISEMERLEHE